MADCAEVVAIGWRVERRVFQDLMCWASKVPSWMKVRVHVCQLLLGTCVLMIDTTHWWI